LGAGLRGNAVTFVALERQHEEMGYVRTRASTVGLLLLGAVGVLAIADVALHALTPVEIAVGILLVLVSLCAIMLLYDVTRSLDASVASRAELRVRLGQQEAIARLGELTLSDVSWQALLDEACRVVAIELRSDLAAVLELLPGGEEFVVRAGTGLRPGTVGVQRLPAGPGSQDGYPLASGRPVILRDAASETRFVLSPAWLEHGVTSGLSMSIGANGTAYGVLGAHTYAQHSFSARDITFLQSVANLLAGVRHRHTAEAETERAYQVLEAVIEGTTDDVFVKDLDGRFVIVNARAAETLGLPREQLIGRTLHEVLPAELAEAMTATDRLTAEQGETGLFEETVPFGGQLRTFLTAKGPYRASDDTLLGTFGIARDITERKRFEEELRLARDYADRLIETSNAILIVLDKDANILTFNRAAEEITGYTREEVLGHNWDILLPRDRYPEPWGAFAELVADGVPERYENAILTKDGEERMILWRNSKLDDLHGNVVGTVSFGIDVTETVAAKEHSQRLETQLRHAERLEAIGQLAGGVAHDFNNLLVGIRGYGELALKRIERADSNGAEELTEILRAADRAADLTAQLLAFGRRQVLKLEVLDLNDVVLETAALLTRLIGENVELVVLPSHALVKVNADRGQLAQVLTNLAVNARDAMPGGGRVTIRVSAAPPTDGNAQSFALLSVSDEGTGIDAATTSRIFEPFFTTKGEKGTGLGLATVYGIVAQSGGEVTVETEPGQGSTFNVSLPLCEEQIAVAAAPVAPQDTDGSETVMLVEDDPMVRSVVASMLAERGYDVVTASSGDEAIKRFQTLDRPIDLIISDLIMHGLDGQETVQSIRRLKPATKALYMSGYTDSVAIRQGELRPDTSFIQKPFSGDELAIQVRQLLEPAL
jgi:two-component system cell cycle sensor histidine kinase/response regulator CckA